MLDVLVPKAALTVAGLLCGIGGGLFAALSLSGPAADGARDARLAQALRGPMVLLQAGLPLGALLCFPRLGLHPGLALLGGLGPLGAALAPRGGGVGLLGAIFVCFGPAALLGLLADGALASALVAGLHGGLGALFVGLLSRAAPGPAAGRAALLGLGLLLSGALRARAVGEVDPARVSALGAQWEPARGAPLRLGAIPRELDQTNLPEGIRIPKALSLLATWDPDGALPGAKATPIEQRAPVTVAAPAASGMALFGLLAVVLAGVGARGPAALRPLALRFAAPLAGLAQLLGLLLSDLGRGGLLLRPDLSYGAAAYRGAALPGALWALLSLGLAALSLRRLRSAR
ncbi:MAG: cytochrome ubiquinol oxidase subunit I [Deltaproteobacteria bacterium]|nr:cytochrome ubiquinol oxidase subunit I [Deltaproteobacteria bacterium]